MKKWLNNPLVVGILVLLALAFVLRDFIHLAPIFSSKPAATPITMPVPLSVSPSSLLKPAPLKTTAKKSAQTTLTHTNWERLAKIPLSSRDPFAPPPLHAPLSHSSRAVAVAAEEVAIPVMILRAIVSAADIHYASINGKLLNIGASIDGWKLVAIGVNRVQLRGNSGLLTLDIDGGARMGGKPLTMATRHPVLKAKGKLPSSSPHSTAATSIPTRVEDLNMYQGLYDSLIKRGVIPNMQGLK